MGWNLVLLAFMVVLLIGAFMLLMRAQHYKTEQEHLKNQLADEVDDLLARIQEVRTKTSAMSDSQLGLLDNKKYLATLLTLVVKKIGGEVTLHEDDFDDLATDSYISIYADPENNSLILMLNKLLSSTPGLVSDEETYH